jgi:hypothetical protein
VWKTAYRESEPESLSFLLDIAFEASAMLDQLNKTRPRSQNLSPQNLGNTQPTLNPRHVSRVEPSTCIATTENQPTAIVFKRAPRMTAGRVCSGQREGRIIGCDVSGSGILT